MARDLTPEQLDVRRKARRLAEKAGKKWGDLSKEERRSLTKEARKAGSDASTGARAQLTPAKGRPDREQAKAAAQKAGHQWAALSREERRKYIVEARKQAR